MKKNVFMLLVAATMIISCSKDDDNNNGGSSTVSGNTSKLCNKNWKLTSVLLDNVEYIGFLDSCELDNFTRFNTNNTYVNDEGGLKCDPLAPQTQNGVWSWKANETQISIDTSENYNVLVNSGTVIKLSSTDSSSGVVSVFTFGL
jgi:hypothetical protein